MKKLILAAMFCFSAGTMVAQTDPLWLRYPAISPDGKNIAFGYKGDIYLVSSSGGQAVPLTLNEAQDMMPIWSRDSKTIAFASNRYGNFDVFTMPATGGSPTRLTFNSANDYPYDFSPDNKTVIFASARNAPAKNVRFHSPRIFQNLYSVSIKGGKPFLVSAAGMERAHFNNEGSQLVFEDRKGYEDALRKHHVSSVTRDIWTMDIKKNTYTKITSFEGEDREPIYSADDQWIYFLSEKEGNQNLFKISAKTPGNYQQLTTFKENPVRHLSRTSDNTLCFTQDGEIYTLKENGTPKKVKISILNDGRDNIAKTEPVNGNVSEFALSPNGKEIAFVNRGEIFVTGVESGQTKQITRTPAQERMIQWSPDGKSIIYATERNNSWDIYRSTILQKDEPYFFASTVIKDEPLIDGPEEQFQPLYSPDGKEIAYVENRNVLKVYNIASKKTRTLLPEGHNHSYSDGDWSFQWSPDSKWLISDDQNGHMFMTHTAMIKADGSGKIFYPINSGFGEGGSKWALNGKMMTWTSSRNGLKSLATSGNAEVDIYGVFFDQDAYDRANMSKDDFALLKEREEREEKEHKTSKDSTDTKKVKTKTKADTTKKAFEPDFTNLDNRRVKLTINSSSISDYALNPDASKLFYLASFESGYDLWVTDTRTHETKILAKLGGSPSGIEMSKDGKTLFLSNGGRLVKVESESGKVSPVSISGDMTIDAAAERNFVFEHAWRQVKEKFYDPKMEGVDWKRYKEVYAKFLPYINNNFDFQELLSEMLGELNASHTGGRYTPNIANADRTAALGLLYDETSAADGLKITEVIAGGPLNVKTSKVKAGDVLEKIDNMPLTSDTDWAKFLNNKAGKNILLSFYNEGTKTRWTERIKPISSGEEGSLMYKRWTNKMAEMVDRLSDGKVGYVHVEGMNDASFREVYDVVMGKNLEKKALIVDTRFNGGGWLHDDLNTFLSGKKYLEFAPQGNRLKDAEPANRWQKPSCVVMNESNYSDAFIFPYIYKQNGVGKLIGMPVAGTGTAVWWERQIDPTLVFGIPMVATLGKENRPTENLQVEPDIKVQVPYEVYLSGSDSQIEAAVKEMLKEIK